MKLFTNLTVLISVFSIGALPTANFKEIEAGQAIFNIIKQENPDFPLMVMEFWTGWFDHWGQPHSFDDVDGQFLSLFSPSI